MSHADYLQWVGIVVVLFGLWRVSRGGGGSAVSELSQANRVLERRNHELGAEVRDLRVKVARLEQRTDYAAVMAAHEENAQRRADGILKVLDLIAQRLGSDPNGVTV